jgi:hypothetical protein
MWPVIIGVGVIVWLLDAFETSTSSKTGTRKGTSVNRKKVFISFAIEDQKYRDFLVKQAKNKKSPFDLIDMSVKQPWDEHEWKRKCRQKIRRCEGVLVLLSKNTWQSGGVRWEIRCANEEGIPVVGMHIQKDERGAIPPELKGRIITWTWDNLSRIIKNNF